MTIDKPRPNQSGSTETPTPPLDGLLAAIEGQIRENPSLRAVDFAVDDYREVLAPIRANIEELRSGNFKTPDRRAELLKELTKQLDTLRDKQIVVEDRIRAGKVSVDQLFPNKLKELVKLSETLATMRRNTEGLERAIVEEGKKSK